MLIFYVSTYQPTLVDNFIIKIDVMLISSTAKKEHERVEKIMSLEIPYDEKQVLLNRTIFLQASQEMTRLALGDPKSVIQDPAGSNNRTLFIYYMPEDKRPTILVFENDRLTSAYKGSALDIH